MISGHNPLQLRIFIHCLHISSLGCFLDCFGCLLPFGGCQSLFFTLIVAIILHMPIFASNLLYDFTYNRAGDFHRFGIFTSCPFFRYSIMRPCLHNLQPISGFQPYLWCFCILLPSPQLSKLVTFYPLFRFG